ncbi:protein of unknown function [Taphrina deformans PYCC 5710]|uniref:Uncharacterized protein n=1 Tax=Taphrina deformans (strain PYCC 5710 / ATCC 11124 / CBS 356.35 / IMI 108563 / JCM 9778 / NBRC 8474) TaxID=1097556 RepID=R4XHT1_TAPDE|nr:protein of unknown function [Taphrina deformans PYCC 5710]|eukprot:CCG82972.1 protein of unknown function [Taphrina deformans PYCC 5710]
MSTAAASKSPNRLSSGFLPPPGTNQTPRSMRKGITTQLVYVPLSPRLQALASPGPCTPFSLEEVSGDDYVTPQRDGLVQDKLDAAFTRHRGGPGERKTYSSVLATQR